MRHIYVTGWNGFIGTSIKSFLEDISYAGLENCSFTYVNLRDSLPTNKTGMLIHLAGAISERESFVCPTKYIEDNCKLLALLLQSNNFSGVIFPSSLSVYNSKGESCPTSVYGATKLFCENLIRLLVKDYWILRIANPYGSFDTKSVFAHLARCKKQNEVFTVYNNNYILRDFFPVDWLVRIIYDILLGKISSKLIYNVGSGNSVYPCDVLKRMCIKHNIRFVFADPPDGMSSGVSLSSSGKEWALLNNNLLDSTHNIEEEWQQIYLKER
jgi:nucleoside-diphosphate-sugar epimerase